MHSIFDPLDPKRKQALSEIDQELRERLPWLHQTPFKINNSEGYDGNFFGARAGHYDNLNVANVLHEAAHAIEMTLLPSSNWRRRVKQSSFGMRVKSFQTIMGERYYEPETIQATERECRVGGIQLHLLEMGAYTTAGFVDEFVVSLKYMADSYFGGGCVLNAHDPEKYTDAQKTWVSLRTEMILQSYATFTHNDIQKRWACVMSWLATPVRKSRLEAITTDMASLPL
jgi:hypothetical protein